jgi:hypothetical protein
LSGVAVEGIGLGMIRTPKPGQANRAVLADFEWAAIRLFFQTNRVAFPVLTTGAFSTASFIGRRI